MSDSQAFSANETLSLMVNLGKQRASKNNDIVEMGEFPEDYVYNKESGIGIHDPWKSSCGRFEVDPFITYGRDFTEWLMRPFYMNDDGIVRRLNETLPMQGVDHG